MHLNLVVLRAKDIERLGRFYESLGMNFVREKHGSGPEHLACTLHGATFEIYPCGPSTGTAGMRIGFCVERVSDRFVEALANGAESVTQPRKSEWGERAVIRDPEGHLVEFLNPSTAR